jgi:aminotransferase
MDGWRVGYLAAPLKMVGDLLKVHQYTVSCPNTFVQKAALTALTSSQDTLQAMTAEFGRRRRLVLDWLKSVDLPCVIPYGAFYFFPSIVKYGLSSAEFCLRALEKKSVALVPGSAFGPSGEGFFRLSYAVAYEKLEKGLMLLSDYLTEL